jgi:regulatory protein
LQEEAAEPELAAALAYARRRRLGPYRSPAARTDLREKDLAALGRQGFGTTEWGRYFTLYSEV